MLCVALLVDVVVFCIVEILGDVPFCSLFVFLIIRRPPCSTRPDTLFPFTSLFPSVASTSGRAMPPWWPPRPRARCGRSEEHTSALQSLMRISYADFCLKKKEERGKYQHPSNLYGTYVRTQPVVVFKGDTTAARNEQPSVKHTQE